MQNAEKSVTYINELNSNDPFYRWVESRRWTKTEYRNSLADYFDRIVKHPGQIDLVFRNILKNTLDDDPCIEELNRQYAIFHKEIENLDLCVETTKENELYQLQKRVEGNVPIVKPARKFITKVCSSRCSHLQGYFACIVPTKREIKNVGIAESCKVEFELRDL